MAIKFSRLKEVLRPEHYEDLGVFIRGQTCDYTDGEPAIYNTDLLRWLEGRTVID